MARKYKRDSQGRFASTNGGGGGTNRSSRRALRRAALATVAAVAGAEVAARATNRARYGKAPGSITRFGGKRTQFYVATRRGNRTPVTIAASKTVTPITMAALRRGQRRGFR